MSECTDDRSAGLDDLAAETRRWGVALVARVAERFAELADRSVGGGRATRSVDGDLRSALRATRVQTERALEASFAAVTEALDSYATLADHLLDRDRPGESTERIEVEAVAGGTTRHVLWVHNTTTRPTPPVAVRVNGLFDAEGKPFDGEVVVEPPDPDVVPPSSSTSYSLVFRAGDSARGRYDGLAVADGLDDHHVHLTVRVGRSAG